MAKLSRSIWRAALDKLKSKLVGLNHVTFLVCKEMTKIYVIPFYLVASQFSEFIFSMLTYQLNDV